MAALLHGISQAGRAGTSSCCLVLAGGDRSGSLSSVSGGRSSGAHTLHAGSEGVKVGGVVAGPGWLGLRVALASRPVWVAALGHSALPEVCLRVQPWGQPCQASGGLRR